MTDAIGPGAFVAVVGASGSGKDALIAYARGRCSGVEFPRRLITRPPGSGEDHIPMDLRAFAHARASGGLAVWWHAHGLDYGLPVSIDDTVRAGGVVVGNVSRGVIDELARRYLRLIVVRVSVSEPVRAERLRNRQRETDPQIEQRMSRPEPSLGRAADLEIDNDGAVEIGGQQLVGLIEAARTTG